MAIVFDTAAELEAFCEAFELRAEQQNPIRKRRPKFIEPEHMMDEPQAILSLVENTGSVEDSLVIGITSPEDIPIPELIEDAPVMLASAS